jgi:mannose/fructose-specific phosphotransferase system component IIA
MSEELRGVVVGHGGLGAALVAAAEEITGLRGVLVAVSNTGADRDALEARVVDAVGNRPAIVFVDMPSGSCLIATMRKLAARPDIKVVTGVNLVMLLEFLFHRAEPIAEAARRVAESGAKSIAQR